MHMPFRHLKVSYKYTHITKRLYEYLIILHTYKITYNNIKLCILISIYINTSFRQLIIMLHYTNNLIS